MIYFFDDWQLNTRLYVVQRAGKTRRLSPKVFQSLLYLLEHRDKVVSKQELAERIWSEQFVSDATLESTIRSIRRALGDSGKTQRMIQTLSGHGYRFVAPLRGTREETESVSSPPVPLLPALPTVSLVGRQGELAQLQEACARALQGERQVVFVAGEPGIGKTTLVDTFVSSLSGRPALWVGRGQCIEHYGEGEAYLPVFEALRQLSQHMDREPFVALLSQYAPTWLAQLPFLVNPAEWGTLQQKIQGATRQRMLRELAEALEIWTGSQAGADAPLLVLVLEDLQWSDYSTTDLISLLAQRREPVRCLVIGTYRPADVLRQAHPLTNVIQELLRHGQCRELRLQGLSAEAIDEYLQQRFPESALPDALGSRLHRWTEGNPFFFVTLLNEWAERGVLKRVNGEWELEQTLETVATAVPDSIRHMIALQLERLTPLEQQVLHAASVAGAEFSTAAVAAGLQAEMEQVEDCCDSLARRQLFLLSTGTTVWPDGTLAASYRFQHALQHTICYERVTPTRCRQLHLRIGTCEERGYAAHSDDHAAALALHFAQGGDARKALHYSWQAGNNAMARYAHHEAITHWTRGFTFLPALGDGEEQRQHELTLLTALGAALIATEGYAAPEVERVYARALELCQQHDESPQLLKILLGLHAFYTMRGQLETASALAERCFHMAKRLDEPARLLQAHWALGLSCFYTGRLPEARAHLRQVIAAYQPQQHNPIALQDPGITSLAYDALALWLLGFADQAVQRHQHMLTLAQHLAQPFSRAWALSFAAMLHYLLRQAPTAQSYAEQGIELCRQQGFAMYLAMNTMIRGWALTVQGQSEEGLAAIHRGLARYTATGASLSVPTYLSLLAESYQHSNQPEAALPLVHEALEIVHKTGERLQESELYRLKGDLLLACRQSSTAPGSVDARVEAERCFRQADAIAQAQGARFFALRIAGSYSTLQLEQGERAAARHTLATALHWFTEGLDTPDVQAAQKLLAHLS